MKFLAWVFFMYGGVNPEVAIYIMKNKEECMAMQRQVGGQSVCKYTMILTDKVK